MRYFPTVCPRKNICADEYTLRVRPRFHVPGVNATCERVELPDDEAEHLVRVLRLGVGDEVDVFDGRGGLWRAEVVQADKKSAAIRADRAGVPAAREIGVQLTLVISVLKGDKMDDVVRDAVMLGVTAFGRWSASGRRSAWRRWRAAAGSRGGSASRCRRRSSAAARWCRRSTTPLPLDWYWNERPAGARMMCVEPSAALGEVIAVQAVAEAAAADVIVGPEGGWAVAEVAAAHDSGAILMSLGGRTLRADAVPIVALTALLTTWGELR